MIKSIIVARSDNHVIGSSTQLPWYMPADLQHFKKITWGHHLIMGRKTFNSVKKLLSNRTTILLTRNLDYQVAGCLVTHTLQDAFLIAQKTKEEELFIVGGGEIYEQVLAFDLVDKIYLTEIHTNILGDVFFPMLNRYEWEEQSRIDHQADNKNPYNYSFVELIKKSK